MKKNLRKILTIMLAVILIMQASLASVSAFGWGNSSKNKGRSYPSWGWSAPKPSSKEEPAPAPAEEPAPEEVEAPAEEIEEEAEPVEAPAEEVPAEEPAVVPEEEPAQEEAPAEEPAPEVASEPEAPAEPEVEYPVLQETKDVKKTDITVSVDAPEGAFPEGTALDVSKVATSAVEDAAAEIIDGEITEIAAVDISFVNDGEKIEPAENKVVDVVISAPAIKEGALPKLIHIKDDGTVEEILDVEFDQENGTVKFSSGEFSTYALVWEEDGNKKEATIHWGTYEDDTFTELAPTTTIDSTAASIKLDVIIDAEKYYFVGAEYKTDAAAETGRNLTSTTIKKVDGVWQMTLESTTEGGSPETVEIADGSHIYVNYAKYGEGGYTPPPTPPVGVLPPTTEKNVTANPDGTYTIQLDITGKQDQTVQQIGANVIIVMDITQSMTNAMPGSTASRMAAAKSALNTLISALDPDTNLINFTAVNFGVSQNGATLARDWTTQKSQMTAYVTGLPNNPNEYGTNWKAGLQGGQSRVDSAQASDSLKNNETYVIFVTDGNPNCYRGNNNDWHPSTGPGFNQQAYNAAVPVANTLGASCHLYGVFVGDDAGYDHLEDLIEGANGEKVINGTNQTALEDEFSQIAQTIVENLGAGSVVVDDGVPALSDISANVTGGEAGGFEYFIKPEGGTQQTWTEAPGASYSKDNGVTWNLSEAGILKNNWVYTLKFTVWPTQEAYDLIADLNNGLVVKTEEDLEKLGIGQDDEGVYYLLTNTHLHTTFKDLEGNVYQNIPEDYASEAMVLPTNIIKVEKYWRNEMDAREAQDVTLTVTRDDEDYEDIVMGPPVETIPRKEWKQTPTKTIYISVGLMSCDDDGNLNIHSSGHDYTVVEPPEFSYRWDLSADIYHPMIINDADKATSLIEVKEEDIPTSLKDLDNNKKATDDGKTYYKFDNKLYLVEDGDTILTAYNDRRSSLYIDKRVTGTDVPEDAVFAIKITLDNPNDPHPGDEGYSNWFNTMWFAVQTDPRDRDTIVTEGVTVEGATPEEGNTGFYWFDNGGSAIVYLKANQYIVINNLSKGTTFTIEELGNTEMPEGFVFDNATSTAINKQDEVVTPAAIDDAVAEGTIERPNSEYTVTYNNKYEGVFYVYHSKDCSVERFPMAVNGVAYSAANPFNIHGLTLDDSLYGGYYSDYAGKSSGFDAAAAAELDYSGGENPKDSGTAYTYQYIKDSGKGAWTYGNGYDVNGKAMVPVKNTVYYLKEVPTGYLLPYTHYTYYKANKKIGTLWTITATDDLCYSNAGFKVQTDDKPAIMLESMTITPQNNSSSVVTLTAGKVFKTKGVLDGWLGYADITSYLGNTTKIQQYWITKDQITVFGIKQRELSNGTTITTLKSTDTAYSES